MPEPTVPDLATAAGALRDLLGAMDRLGDHPVSTLAQAAAPELAVLRRWAAEATEPPPVCPYIVTTDDATSYCSLAASAGPAPDPQGTDEPTSPRLVEAAMAPAPDSGGDVPVAVERGHDHVPALQLLGVDGDPAGGGDVGLGDDLAERSGSHTCLCEAVTPAPDEPTDDDLTELLSAEPVREVRP
jgi:hypothetical protein